MRLVLLGLSVTSAWGNGHATTWRALMRGLARRGHELVFLERDMPWYAAHRDFAPADDDAGGLGAGVAVRLYRDLAELDRWIARELAAADAVILGSYVPDGIAVAERLLAAAPRVTAFYDIDTPVTQALLAAGGADYIAAEQLRRFDLYLSFTGGPILERIEDEHGVRAARPLYCSVDAERWRPQPAEPRFDLGYLGTWSADRQPKLERMLLQPARARPDRRFAVAGPLYPAEIAWPGNVERIQHVAPADHPAFYAAQRFTLNITRDAMVAAGWSPSVRLFEAAACGVPIISDGWRGLDELFIPGEEILLAEDAEDVLRHMRDTSEVTRRRIGTAARRRVLLQHTATARAAELERHLEEAAASRIAPRRRRAL